MTKLLGWSVLLFIYIWVKKTEPALNFSMQTPSLTWKYILVGVKVFVRFHLTANSTRYIFAPNNLFKKIY
jgi:hypothetical protein